MDLNDTGNRIIAVVIVALLIIGAWFLGTKSSSMAKNGTATTTVSTTKTSSSTKSAITTTSSSSSAMPQISGNSITVKDQAAGGVVKVESVTLPENGWIAIRDDGGRILGAHYYPAGTLKNVEVPLLRGMVSGGHYQALLYTDVGADRKFQSKTDTMITSGDGTVLGTTFKAN